MADFLKNRLQRHGLLRAQKLLYRKGLVYLRLNRCVNYFSQRKKRKAILSNMPAPFKLHLGCGNTYLEGYVNSDVENWSGRCDLICSATDLSFLPSRTVDHIFHHAMIEHLPPWETTSAMKEWYRVLKEGGTIQIETPDLERVFEDWLVNQTLSEKDAIANIFGGNKSPQKAYSAQHHLTGFTYARLARMMSDVGFHDFSRKEHLEYHHILVVCARK